MYHNMKSCVQCVHKPSFLMPGHIYYVGDYKRLWKDEDYNS